MGKVTFSLVVIALVVLTYLILTAAMPVFVATSNTAASDPSMASFPSAEAALRTSPIWIYFIPGIVGIVAIAIKLRSKEK